MPTSNVKEFPENATASSGNIIIIILGLGGTTPRTELAVIHKLYLFLLYCSIPIVL